VDLSKAPDEGAFKAARDLPLIRFDGSRQQCKHPREAVHPAQVIARILLGAVSGQINRLRSKITLEDGRIERKSTALPCRAFASEPSRIHRTVDGKNSNE
jgi:hypothetical protein